MGCIKLDILEKSFVLMKVVYRNFDVEQKNVQRFLRVDPLYEKYPDFSPYSYCMGNPVRFVDPDGRGVYGHRNEDGSMSYVLVDSESETYTNENGTYIRIDDSFEIQNENGSYKTIPSPLAIPESQTTAKENWLYGKKLGVPNGGFLMTGGSNSECGLGSKSESVDGIIDCTGFASAFSTRSAGRTGFGLLTLLQDLIFKTDNIAGAGMSASSEPTYEYESVYSEERKLRPRTVRVNHGSFDSYLLVDDTLVITIKDNVVIDSTLHLAK